MSTIKYSASSGNRTLTVEGDPEVARAEFQRLGTSMGIFQATAGEESSGSLGDQKVDSFKEFYEMSNPKRGTQGLIVAKYLTDMAGHEVLRIDDFKNCLSEVGHNGLSMPARANMLKKGWLERTGRGRYLLTETGRRAYDALAEGKSMRQLPVSEQKRRKRRSSGIVDKYRHGFKPVNVIACLLAEKGSMTYEGVEASYQKNLGSRPSNLKLLLKNMTGDRIGTAKSNGGKYQLTDKGKSLINTLTK